MPAPLEVLEHLPSESARRIIPFVVAAPLFLQNFTASVLATALPSLALALHSDVLHLNLAITLYLLSVAVSLPMAAWLCERVGPRRLFCLALIIFSLGSVAAALSQSLWQLAAARVFQGVGGAMMIPVGRLILLRSMPPHEIVRATIWYTVPPAVGAIIGPLVGGFVVSYLSWQWLFWINVPIALAACIFALRLLDKDGPGQKIPLDLSSYGLLALALLGVLAGMAGSGKGLLPGHTSIALVVAGLFFFWIYLRHARQAAHPVMDFSLLRFATFRASIVGGLGIRIGQGAAPFMLPLLFQLGFGLSPLAAGGLIFLSAVGSLLTRPILDIAIRRYGFRHMLIGTTALCSVLYFSFALMQPGMPYLAIVALLILSGGARGMLLVSMNTLGYTEIPKPKMSYATALSTMAQQVSNTFGVALAVLLLNLAMSARQASTMMAEDFALGFIVIGVFNAAGLYYFICLPPDVGAELTPAPDDPS